jgi:ATP-dependent Clp protease ATP-binding subunit ClpB
VINFKNTVIIMTSNIASPIIQELTQRGIDQDAVRMRVMEELRDSFRPEFLNRIDEIIVFEPLSREQIGQIVEIQLGRLRRLLAERKITLELTPAARERLGEEGYDPIYGARPLKRVIQQRLQNTLALKLLQGEFREGDTILVDVEANGQFSFAKVGIGEALAV